MSAPDRVTLREATSAGGTMSAARSGEAAEHRIRTVRTEKDLFIVFPPSQQVGRGVGRERTSVRVRNEENESKRMLARTPISGPPRFAKCGGSPQREFFIPSDQSMISKRVFIYHQSGSLSMLRRSSSVHDAPAPAGSRLPIE